MANGYTPQTSTESTLSNWVGPYVTDMLGKGAALAETPYTAYTGPLTAGPSNLQQQAFSGLASLTLPTATASTPYTPTSFTADGVANTYMNPYVSTALTPQMDEARRQAEIERVLNAGRMSRAGAYGGSRQAIMESEMDRNLLDNLAKIYGTGMDRAYESGRSQFNIEEDRRMRAGQDTRNYVLDALGRQLDAGGLQRAIEAEGIGADRAQFQEERDYPYKMVQYMQSLLQGLPLQTNAYSYMQPSGWSSFLGNTGGILSLMEGFSDLFGWGDKKEDN